MKAFLKALTFGLLLLVPLSTAHAQGPSLSPIANVSVNAGRTLNVNVIAIDADNRPITVTAAVPPFATLNAPTIGTGVVVTSLTLAPSDGQVGDFSAAVTATAGGVSTVKVFQITVNAAGSNQAPFVTAPPLQEVTAGSALGFVVTASDPDGDAITSLSTSGLPPGALFTPNGSNTSGTFSWVPGAGDVGEYDVLFTAANALSGTSVTHVRVASAPALTITPIADVTVADGGFASVPVHASGVPGALITLTAALPAFATLNPPGTGTGAVNTTVTVAPPTGSAGTYHASITATSLGTSVTERFDIIVTGSSGGGNHPPVLSAPGFETVAIGATLSFDVTATDLDGDHVDLLGSALPPGSTFTDHGNDTGTFTWTPVSGQAGTYTASFTGLDNRGGSGSASTIITVTGDTIPNHAPTLSAPATQQVNEGVHLAFTVTASDPDGDHVTLSTGSLPLGATFSDNGDNTGAFSWTPGSGQSGTYVVAFLGNDGRGGTGTASTTITVTSAGGGGGGGEVAGRACLIGKFKAQRDSTCFRIQPVHQSFGLRDVVLSSIRLRFHGQSLAALDGARIEVHCPAGRGHGDDGDGDDGNDDHDRDHYGAAANHVDGHHRGDDEGDDDQCHVSCEDCRDDDRDHSVEHGGECDTLGIHACFSTEALLRLFSGANPAAAHLSPEWRRLPCALVDAQILATLTTGDTVVATFHGGDDGDHGKGDDHGKGKGGNGHEGALSAQATPNPLHPMTQLSFTTASDGRVRVAVYDMQGRLVKRLADEFRAAGSQTLTWDGTNEWSRRVTSGIYFIRIQAPEGSVTRRVAVVK
jgi:hypothetical protein